MESSHQARKIIGWVLALLCAVLLALAFWAHLSSPILRTLANRNSQFIRLAVLTQPAMRFSYNPADRNVMAIVSNTDCNPTSVRDCFKGEFDFFYIPQETAQAVFWDQFKENLASWRYQPIGVLNYLRAYINALVQKRTNLPPGEFILLSEELASLTATDFAVEYSKTTPKKKGNKAIVSETPSSPQIRRLAQAGNKPLKVIILNASGKRGLAESLKQYLRGQYAKGLLQVDVYDTGNYPSEQDNSFLIDYSGNLVQVTQLSHAIGINGEIRSEAPIAEFYDTTIVLGKDFEIPL